MHYKIGPRSCCKELADLVVSGDSRAAHLDDVHVVSREVELTIGFDELSDEIRMFNPTIMRALTIRAENVGTRSSSCVDNSVIFFCINGALQWRLH